MNFTYEEGKNGKWRWFCWKDGVLIASGPVHGFDTRGKAMTAATLFLDDCMEYRSVDIRTVGTTEWSFWELALFSGLSFLVGVGAVLAAHALNILNL